LFKRVGIIKAKVWLNTYVIIKTIRRVDFLYKNKALKAGEYVGIKTRHEFRGVWQAAVIVAAREGIVISEKVVFYIGICNRRPS
jgi:hypothetical protein